MACEAECRALLTIQAGSLFTCFLDKNHHKRIAKGRSFDHCNLDLMVSICFCVNLLPFSPSCANMSL